MEVDHENLLTEYKEKQLRYMRLAKDVQDLLDERLRKEPVDIINFTNRLKTFDSFYAKILSDNLKDNFFEHINDVAGTRFVCKYYSELDMIAKIIEKIFNVVAEDRKTRFRRINEFGYLSDHFIVKLKPETTKPSEEDLLDLKCEIQVRTLLMHSWATVSHDLDYKNKENLNEEIRRELYAISGLLYLTDQRFDSFKNTAIEASKVEKEESSSTFDKHQTTSPKSLNEYLKRKFPDRDSPNVNDYEIFASELLDMEFTTIENLDNAIEKAESVLNNYEAEFPPDSIPKSRYNVVGAARICIALVDSIHDKSKSFYVVKLEKFREMLS